MASFGRLRDVLRSKGGASKMYESIRLQEGVHSQVRARRQAQQGEVVTAEEKGFTQGVGWAIAELLRSYNDKYEAERLFADSGIPMSDFRKAGVDEADRQYLRRVSPTRRSYYARKGSKHADG